MFKIILCSLVVTIVGVFILSTIDPNSANNPNNQNQELEYTGDDAVNVSIDGQILHPGKYTMSPQATLSDLIFKAGGVLEDHDPKAYTPSLVIGTRTSFYIPKKSKLSEVCYEEEIQKVNINKEDATTIDEKTELGETQAKSVVTYREENGPFEAIEDIMEVSGIGEGTFAKIKDQICLA